MCEDKKRSEEELVALFRGGDKGAGEELLLRYKSRVLKLARGFFIAGGDTEDLVQEGMFALYSAMNTFGQDSAFSTYAYACIKNRMIDAIKKSGNSKNSALNLSESLPEDGGGPASTLLSPEDALISDEADSEIKNKMKSALSPLEYKAICMYTEGATMSEISVCLGKTYKQTDNAIARAKHKLRDILIK